MQLALWTGLLVGCLVAAGCMASGTRSLDHEPSIERAVARLERQADADSLAAAALLSLTRDRVRSLTLLARAEVAAPARPDLVWLFTQLCRNEPSCDPKPEEVKLRALRPTNGAAWLGELERAIQTHDERARETALSAIARTERVDLYWTTLVAHLSDAAIRVGRLAPAEASVTVSGVVAATGIPAYGRIVKLCSGDALDREDHLNICRGVANALEHGDTAVTEMIGVAMAKRVWPEGSTAWTEATERRRVFDYRSATLRDSAPARPNAQDARQYLAHCAAELREQDVTRALLIDAGKDPDPPAG